jgi:hypothetical protein
MHCRTQPVVVSHDRKALARTPVVRPYRPAFSRVAHGVHNRSKRQFFRQANIARAHNECALGRLPEADTADTGRDAAADGRPVCCARPAFSAQPHSPVTCLHCWLHPGVSSGQHSPEQAPVGSSWPNASLLLRTRARPLEVFMSGAGSVVLVLQKSRGIHQA